jgi:very-short-patch-repair endonuclease
MYKVARKPSCLEKKLYNILNSLHVLYWTEVWRGPYPLDCYLPAHNIAIEADGPQHAYRREKDRRRDTYLWEHHGIRVLRLGGEQLRNNQAAACAILAFIRKWSAECQHVRKISEAGACSPAPLRIATSAARRQVAGGAWSAEYG